MVVMPNRTRVLIVGSIVVAMMFKTAGVPHVRGQVAPSFRWQASGHLSEARMVAGCGNASPPTGWNAALLHYHETMARILTVLADWSGEPALTLKAVRHL